MTPSRYSQSVRELTHICRKVFEATPISEVWHDAAIMAEMRRNGSNVDGSIIRGCLESLRKTGLVVEVTPRHFQRIREPLQREQITMPVPAAPESTTTTHRPASSAPAPTRKVSPMERIAAISIHLRHIADELDDLAIQTDEDMKAQGQDSETLRQLQKLLGNIGARA